MFFIMQTVALVFWGEKIITKQNNFQIEKSFEF